MPPQRIAIAGFGIAGGALAVLLARRGHRVTLFERAPAVGPVGAGFLLQPSGQGVLARMGLLPEVAAASEEIAGLRAFTPSGRRLITLGNGPHGPALGVHRGLLFEVLHRAVRGAGVEVELGFTAAGIRERAGEVALRAEDGREAGPYDLLVAADGARSRLRRVIDPGVREVPDPYAALWAVGTCSAIRGHLFQVAGGTRVLLGLLPLGSGRTNFFWGLAARDWEGLRRSSFDAFCERILRLAPQAEEIFASITSFEHLVFGGYVRARPRTLVRGRAVLIGDAAHPMPPHLGQGLNLGLLDAESLATALEHHADVPTALAEHARGRRDQVRFYGQLSRLLAPFFQSDLTPLGPLRDLGLPLLTRLPPLRRAMEQTLAGRRGGWWG